jgi:FKBP-type peptidyl-prolyl cis-trans isomerase
MKNVFFISCLVVSFFACKSPKKEVDVLADGTQFKLIAFGDSEESLKIDQYLSCYITIAETNGDTIHYVPGFSYFVEYYKESPLYAALNHLHLGDSFHLTIDESALFEAFGFDNLREDSKRKLELRIRALEFVEQSKIKNVLTESLTIRLQNEAGDIQNYLSNQSDRVAYIYEEDIYIKTEIKSTNSPIQFGDQVTLEYDGQFLDGYVFDSKRGDQSLEIVYGMSDQVIRGIELGIKGLSEGESVKIILPSHLAFGAEGSVKGIVPPYTPVAYKIFIKKVTHKLK